MSLTGKIHDLVAGDRVIRSVLPELVVDYACAAALEGGIPSHAPTG